MGITDDLLIAGRLGRPVARPGHAGHGGARPGVGRRLGGARAHGRGDRGEPAAGLGVGLREPGRSGPARRRRRPARRDALAARPPAARLLVVAAVLPGLRQGAVRAGSPLRRGAAARGRPDRAQHVAPRPTGAAILVGGAGAGAVLWQEVRGVLAVGVPRLHPERRPVAFSTFTKYIGYYLEMIPVTSGAPIPVSSVLAVAVHPLAWLLLAAALGGLLLRAATTRCCPSAGRGRPGWCWAASSSASSCSWPAAASSSARRATGWRCCRCSPFRSCARGTRSPSGPAGLGWCERPVPRAAVVRRALAAALLAPVLAGCAEPVFVPEAGPGAPGYTRRSLPPPPSAEVVSDSVEESLPEGGIIDTVVRGDETFEVTGWAFLDEDATRRPSARPARIRGRPA